MKISVMMVTSNLSSVSGQYQFYDSDMLYRFAINVRRRRKLIEVLDEHTSSNELRPDSPDSPFCLLKLRAELLSTGFVYGKRLQKMVFIKEQSMQNGLLVGYPLLRSSLAEKTALEMEIHDLLSKRVLSEVPEGEREKTRLQLAKEKQLWTVDDQMKVIFSDESQICIGQGYDAGTFVWCRSNEIYKDDCLKRTCKFPVIDMGLHVRESSLTGCQMTRYVASRQGIKWATAAVSDSAMANPQSMMKCSDIGWGFIAQGTGPCYIHTVAVDSPAAEAGMKVCQFIKSVNGINCLHLDYYRIYKIIEAGTWILIMEVLEPVKGTNCLVEAVLPP
ncbi:unnamed protein product [Ranitomeya imitator]|uniref:PDZ domain-containing protein n=1 Tax=Ranitomeya imitator TaxID=111125 RepID=A0ABN9MB16_9NEOB|nr:unnamed protein product [Ranitomeya imitator]